MLTRMIVRILALGILVVTSACKPSLIPNTSVKDTRENRAVVAFIGEYQKAITARSVPDIMALVSPDYLETNATTEASDDYSYAQLQEKLEKTYAQVKEVTLRIHVQNITRQSDKFDVFYFYNQHSLISLPSGEQWAAVNDVNRLVLKLKGRSLSDGFEITSGL